MEESDHTHVLLGRWVAGCVMLLGVKGVLSHVVFSINDGFHNTPCVFFLCYCTRKTRGWIYARMEMYSLSVFRK